MAVIIIPGLPNKLAVECLIRIWFDDFPKAACVCRTWRSVIKQPELWQRRKACGLNRRPVIAMAQSMVGMNPPVYRLRLFEAVKGRWYDFPPVEGIPLFSRVVGIGAELAVIGACDPATWRVMKSVFIYNFLSATWRRGSDMPGEERFFFGCAASEEDGLVVVAGGHDIDGKALKSTLAYDVARDKWTALADLSSGRAECTCVFRRGKFQVIGGYDACSAKESTETLHLVTRQWSITHKITNYSTENILPQAIYADIGGVIYTLNGNIDVVALDRRGRGSEDATWIKIARIPDSTCICDRVGGEGDGDRRCQKG